MKFLFVALLAFTTGFKSSKSILYPRDSESRDSKSLDGIWNFRICPSLEPDKGFTETWYSQPLSETGTVMDMPVPSSFNDITTDSALRDFAGWAWYDRNFLTPSSWNLSLTDVWLRFGSAHYTTMVWVNGQEVMTHEGGHLPFETDITGVLNPSGRVNLLTVAINNTLHKDSIPQGKWEWKAESEKYPAAYFEMTYTFDFFNYAGIHRPVTLYTIPKDISVRDVTVVTTVDQSLAQATVQFSTDIFSDGQTPQCYVQILDPNGQAVAGSPNCNGSIDVSNPNLWWPFMMNANPGYMYTLEINAFNSQTSDHYRLPFGIRQVSWDSASLKINHQNVYMRGVARHEDSNIRGKGLDLPLIAKDFNLMKWMGVNAFRTSHYPYADEIIDFADRNGIMVISECPGVNLETFDQPLLDNHLDVMNELVSRDKNHPSVLMWSIANEPRSYVTEAGPYFQTVADYTRLQDPTRPVTYSASVGYDSDYGVPALDIISINRYFGWYSDTGKLDLIERQFTADIRNWNTQYDKPIIISEHGADTIGGFHELPSTIWTEEYQTDFFEQNFAAFDTTRDEGILIGEFVWNFADFMTIQEYKRAWGNRKGLFTRDRHPKASAHQLRARYLSLAEQVDWYGNDVY